MLPARRDMRPGGPARPRFMLCEIRPNKDKTGSYSHDSPFRIAPFPAADCSVPGRYPLPQYTSKQNKPTGRALFVWYQRKTTPEGPTKKRRSGRRGLYSRNGSGGTATGSLWVVSANADRLFRQMLTRTRQQMLTRQRIAADRTSY